ncbi:hypothetical protein [Methanobrevibacter arboriphilus]|uniref:hypothetical protein n=1 Tax=Methanobrevibacter arboriphilus TaxID=39441 RepID=UPI001180A494|nr:hypothetical protein [Methanobrevibacter arboriphilus]
MSFLIIQNPVVILSSFGVLLGMINIALFLNFKIYKLLKVDDIYFLFLLPCGFMAVYLYVKSYLTINNFILVNIVLLVIEFLLVIYIYKKMREIEKYGLESDKASISYHFSYFMEYLLLSVVILFISLSEIVNNRKVLFGSFVFFGLLVIAFYHIKKIGENNELDEK